MPWYRYTGETRVVFPHVKRTDGRTAELDPGEAALLRVPPGFTHRLLKPIESPRKRITKEPHPEPAAVEESADESTNHHSSKESQ